MVMLKALEAAITQVEKICDHEFTFKVDEQEITLRPLRSHEETEVQRYAQAAWEGMGEDGDTAAYQDFMDRVRLSTLGFSVVRIGDIDLHGVDWLESDEEEDDQPVWVPKWEAVRDLIQTQWSKALALQVFAKFGELLERVEISASRLVKFNPSDLDEEIQRVESRLADLRAKREERKKDNQKSPVQKAQTAVAQVDQRNHQVRTDFRDEATISAKRAASEAMDEGIESFEEDPEPPTPEPPTPPRSHEPPTSSPIRRREARPAAAKPAAKPAPQPERTPQASGRQSSIPQGTEIEEDAAPPDRSHLTDPAPQEQPDPSSLDQRGIESPLGGDSFFDPSDPDAALEAETRRQSQLHATNLRKQREKKMAQQQQEALGVTTGADIARERMQAQRESSRPAATRLDPRTESLRQAANLQDQVFDTGAGRQHSGRPQQAQPQSAGSNTPATLHGKPVYKMPTQTLEKPALQQNVTRKHGEPRPSPVQINPTVGARQDKFRGPTDR